MTTTSQPRARRTSTRGGASAALPWLALAALCAVTLAIVLRAGRGLTFFGDEWAFLLRRRGLSPATFLAPHNEHPSVGPVAIYKTLEHVFGMRHYLPYQLAVAALHLATGVFLYVYARRRVGPWLGLIPAALLLFLGAAWEDVMWAFQVGFIGSVTAGLATLVALDARRYKLACLALVISVTSSGLGLPFLVAAGVELVLEPGQRRRAAWILGIPVIAVAVIMLGYHGTSNSQFSQPSHTVHFAAEMAAAGFAAIGGMGGSFGHPLAVISLIALVLVARRDGGLSPRAIGLLCGAAFFWLLTGSGRADLGASPDTSRYLYLSAALVLALFVTVPRRPVVNFWTGAVLATATALACLGGAGMFKEGAVSRLPNTTQLLPKLTALEVARGHVAPGVQVDVGTNPDIVAHDYYSARDKFGTPALPVATLRTQGDDRRQAFDAALVTALGLALKPGTGSGTPPVLETSAGGVAGRDGTCVTFKPAGAGARIDVTLLPGRAYTLSADAATPVSLRRLATTYGATPSLQVAPGAPQTLTLPRDRLADPWHLRLAAAAPVRVCG